MCRSEGIYDVKGSVPIVLKFALQRGERGEKGGKFEIEAHRTFDIINTFTPVFDAISGGKQTPLLCPTCTALILITSAFLFKSRIQGLKMANWIKAVQTVTTNWRICKLRGAVFNLD